MSGPDDKAALIVAIARTGDRAAFSNLFMFFAPRVKSYLLRLGMGNGEAEDLAQETLLTVWRKAASFDPERAGASTWIFTIARNLRLDAARRAVGAKIYAEREAIEQRDEMEVSAAELFIVAEDCARVKGALALLPHEQAEIVQIGRAHV